MATTNPITASPVTTGLTGSQAVAEAQQTGLTGRAALDYARSKVESPTPPVTPTTSTAAPEQVLSRNMATQWASAKGMTGSQLFDFANIAEGKTQAQMEQLYANPQERIAAERERQAAATTAPTTTTTTEAPKTISTEDQANKTISDLTTKLASSQAEQQTMMKSFTESMQTAMSNMTSMANTFNSSKTDVSSLLSGLTNTIAKSTGQAVNLSDDDKKQVQDSIDQYKAGSITQEELQQKTMQVISDQVNKQQIAPNDTPNVPAGPTGALAQISSLYDASAIQASYATSSGKSMLDALAAMGFKTNDLEYQKTNDFLSAVDKVVTTTYNNTLSDYQSAKTLNEQVIKDARDNALAQNKITMDLDIAERDVALGNVRDTNSRLEGFMKASLEASGIDPSSTSGMQIMSRQINLAMLNESAIAARYNTPILQLTQDNVKIQTDYANNAVKIQNDYTSGAHTLQSEYTEKLLSNAQNKLLNENQKTERDQQAMTTWMQGTQKLESEKATTLSNLADKKLAAWKDSVSTYKDMWIQYMDKSGELASFDPQTGQMTPLGIPTLAARKDLTAEDKEYNTPNLDITRAFGNNGVRNSFGDLIQGMEKVKVEDGISSIHADANGNLIGLTKEGKTVNIGGGSATQVRLGETPVATDITSVYGTPVKLAPTVAAMVDQAQAALPGIKLSIADSTRSTEAQAKAYASGKAGVAPPGTSFHETGQAIDLDQGDPKMKDPAVWKALSDSGLVQNPKEWWHWSYGEFAGKQPALMKVPKELRTEVTQKANQFDGEQTVKDYNTVQQANIKASNIKDNSTNPQDDQALIYLFAKASDPSSSVREGEYTSVQQFAQPLLQRYQVTAERFYSNAPFLTPEARQNIKKTIKGYYDSQKQSYDVTRDQYKRVLNNLAGTDVGDDILQDYTVSGKEAKTVKMYDKSGAEYDMPEDKVEGAKKAGYSDKKAAAPQSAAPTGIEYSSAFTRT